MSTRVKAGICLALFVALWAGYVYLTWDASQVVAQQWIALGPINWIDFGAGAFLTFITMVVLFLGITLRETKRFDDEIGGGNTGGPSGGAPKRVRLPMSRKVVDIRTWQPPAGGQYHRSSSPSPAPLPAA